MIGNKDEQPLTPKSETINVWEERARVEIRKATTNRVRVATHVETFEQVAHAELQHDEVEITHISIGHPVVGVAPKTRTEGDVTIVPVFEEVLVIEKRLVLKEEIHIRRRVTTEKTDVPVTLRRQVAEVEQTRLSEAQESPP